MDELKIRSERERLYESKVSISTNNEVLTEDYLKRLSKVERENISHLFCSFETLFRTTPTGLMALAVGSTTYSDDYWEGLKSYFEKNDISKLEYAERKGEDIDIILCGDSYYEPSFESFSEWMNFAKKDLDRAKISYSFEERERENGTSYLSIPLKYRFEEGQGVIRHKRKTYGDYSLKIFYENSRIIHLGFSNMIGELKLKQERVEDAPFSLLFRHSRRYDLVDLIEKINSCD